MQILESTSVTQWLQENPIRLRVCAGRVAKSDLAHALNITPASLRHKVSILRDADSDFDALYVARAKRTELPVDLAELIIRMLFDCHDAVRVEFVGGGI